MTFSKKIRQLFLDRSPAHSYVISSVRDVRGEDDYTSLLICPNEKDTWYCVKMLKEISKLLNCVVDDDPYNWNLVKGELATLPRYVAKNLTKEQLSARWQLENDIRDRGKERKLKMKFDAINHALTKDHKKFLKNNEVNFDSVKDCEIVVFMVPNFKK